MCAWQAPWSRLPPKPWRDAIDEVVEAAQHDQALRQRAQAQPPEAVANAEDSEAVQAEPAASVAPVFPQQAQQAASAPTDLPPVAPQEFAQALRPAHDGGTTAAPTVASFHAAICGILQKDNAAKQISCA